MSKSIVAVYSLKGGVGKTTLAVNLAWASAVLGGKRTLLPVFSMVDRRRSLHRDALTAQPGWPVIPMASQFEAMTERRAPLGAMAPKSSKGVQAVAQAWGAVEKALARGR